MVSWEKIFNLLKRDKDVFILFQILCAILVIALFYFGAQFWNNYKEEKDNMLKLVLEEKLALEEQNKLRDQQLQDLKNELTELKNKPPEVKTVTVEAKDTVASLVKEWSPRVAEVECTWAYTNGAVYAKASGSATIIYQSGGIMAVTSRHVLLSQGKYAPRDCLLTLPGLAASYSISNNFKDNFYVGVEEDWGFIKLVSDKTLNTITQKDAKLCSNVEAGDRLIILGYPGIGSKTGLTVTEGIVSGFDGNYYITSAKIDRGNSGGAAILVKDNCYLGIPSASVVGTIESLGRILKASFVIQ
ncbi:hypothetical protein A3A05_03575 [Candidatus Nomurabacteria bacterium RIFCSPLOWO2_01_FULL_41_12]|uniref:Serine protease n=1 Tax=Candidatus Nomurabacteria bacterium RIFCSPLOWO2_01_FULL_41_12 TaxID=1801774 RepID=A0A1F6WUW7_9BACT|nr:MAG: hypothetical protein A2732_02250 [Candidatus Nomurabacteria bacterium RIFCSPHIGHO2_01_FULL_40_10]OGI85677.1 MAG: hypothetical protein A3A05_03575 [Candidatus Nomurabacteria bacterium RIFCSPLOWO2_01_FULL_41_12]